MWKICSLDVPFNLWWSLRVYEWRLLVVCFFGLISSHGWIHPTFSRLFRLGFLYIFVLNYCRLYLRLGVISLYKWDFDMKMEVRFIRLCTHIYIITGCCYIYLKMEKWNLCEGNVKKLTLYSMHAFYIGNNILQLQCMLKTKWRWSNTDMMMPGNAYILNRNSFYKWILSNLTIKFEVLNREYSIISLIAENTLKGWVVKGQDD